MRRDVFGMLRDFKSDYKFTRQDLIIIRQKKYYLG